MKMTKEELEDFFEMGKILVWIKEPHKKAKHVWISPRLENLQKTVGGYIEAHQMTTDVTLLCDEDGRMKGYEPNVQFLGAQFVGTLILVGTKNGEFSSCPISLGDMKKYFPTWMQED